jgi:hypothetical protein
MPAVNVRYSAGVSQELLKTTTLNANRRHSPANVVKNVLHIFLPKLQASSNPFHLLNSAGHPAALAGNLTNQIIKAEPEKAKGTFSDTQ